MTANIYGNVGAKLRDHVVELFSTDPSITEVVAMTRCSHFVADDCQSNEEQLEQYEAYVRSGRDPTIFFHLSGGAEIICVALNYRPEDVANLGNAVLIRYRLIKEVIKKMYTVILVLKIC